MNDQPVSNRPQPVERPIRATRRSTRGSIFWPLILIAVGVAFLLRNVGAVSEDTWENLLRLWPLIMIAIGLDSLYRREGVAGAVFWIGLGVVFLLSNLNIFAWDIWEVIFNLWPILLIAIGLDIVLGRRSTWGAIVAMLLLVAILAGALWFMGGAAPAGLAVPGEQISQELEGATEARVELAPAAGSLHVKALPAEANALVIGTIQKRSGETTRQDFSQSGGKATYNLHTEGFSGFYTPGSRRGPDWDLNLTPSVPLDLQARIGAGELVLDLSGLELSRLEVNMGAGRALVTLPAQGRFEAQINGAIGELVIVVPEGMQVRIQSNTALAGIEVPESFRQDGDVYTTAGYESAENRIDLEASQAIGKITVRMGR